MGAPPRQGDFQVRTQLDNPSSDWSGGEKAVLTVTWWNSVDPCTIAVDMGGGTTENIPAGISASSPFTHEFTLVDGGPYEYTATITDNDGDSDSATGTYSVLDSWVRPVINSAVFNDGRLDVWVSDADSWPLIVHVTEAGWFAVDKPEMQADADGLATFYWIPVPGSIGAESPAYVTVSDELGASEPVEVMIEMPYRRLMAPELLTAIPVQKTAQVGETVTVVVSAYNGFRETQPLAFLNAMAVTVEQGGDYVDGTFNVGAVGGGSEDVDGVWATMSPAPLNFLLPDDFMVHATAVADSGLVFMGFNVTPIFGGETVNAGELFNFGISFAEPGTYHLGFLEFQGVKRSFYSDYSAREYNWNDITNELPGLGATITVN